MGLRFFVFFGITYSGALKNISNIHFSMVVPNFKKFLLVTVKVLNSYEYSYMNLVSQIYRGEKFEKYKEASDRYG